MMCGTQEAICHKGRSLSLLEQVAKRRRHETSIYSITKLLESGNRVTKSMPTSIDGV